MDLMIYSLLFFIGASLLLYIVLGGADYGAGIIELLPINRLMEEQKNLVNEAMGPVWEANHMWLIIIVVILFMGFPTAFNQMMVSLHMPMVALLLGIVVRGSVFTFRHYDAVQDPRSQKIYTWLFGLSSLWTSLWLGIIGASLFRGRIKVGSVDFYEAYIAPWWGLYPLAMGIFVTFNFAFLASIFLVGESENKKLQVLYRRRALIFNFLVVFSGALVFLAAYGEGHPLLFEFISQPISVACMILATLAFALLWFRIDQRRNRLLTRLIAAGQVSLILLGWFAINAPAALLTTDGPLTFFEAAAPSATLFQLTLALLIGSVLIFPALIYLIILFKIDANKDSVSL